MKQLLQWIQTYAAAMGGPGLFAVAVVDASVLSLPEANDILFVWMTIRHESFGLYYAALATVGSVVGSMLIYYAGRKGGEVLVRRGFSGDQVERAMARLRRWGVATIIVPAILPPPMPFKIFCVAAGMGGMTAQTFAMAVGIGRGIRYFATALLAMYLGDLAVEYLARHGQTVGWWLAGLMVAAGVVYYWRQQRRRAAI